jgi:hypothetical protein
MMHFAPAQVTPPPGLSGTVRIDSPLQPPAAMSPAPPPAALPVAVRPPPHLPAPGERTMAVPAAAPVPAAASPAAAPARAPDALKRTMLGFGATPLEPAPAPPPMVTPPAGPAPRHAGLGSTMLGMSPNALQATKASAADPPAAAGGPMARLGSKTMLGVAIPGIAPTRPGETSSPPPEPPKPVKRDVRPRGVDAPLPPIVPPPAPLSEAPPPPPPKIVRKGGVPLAGVALAVGALVLAAGAAMAFLWRRPPPITALARVTPEGTDVLHLTCDPASCADGTVAQLDGASATFAGGASDLPLAQALHVGSNSLTLKIDRPGMGRDEMLSLVVPVAYRVRADVTAMNDPHPSIVIHVETIAGSTAQVDGKPVALDAGGNGTYAIDETIATEGAADESRVVALDIPYSVTSPGQPANTGTVSARVAVAPLRVDTPGAHAVVDADHVLLAGRAAKGASVTIDGAATPVSSEGAFETQVPLPAPGEMALEVRSGTPSLATRSVHVTIKRVTSLADEARAFEKQSTLGYDAALANLATDVGQPIVVEGEVIEPRASGHRTLLLVDDRRGCARGPCLARVVVGQELAVARGDRLRAYGHVARGFTTPSGQTVPEVEADFVLRAKR